ncbi:MAG: Heme/hemopexin-binding protein, partial [Candidatus Anoxychlamydiales bacterium]|nr:Heme/hemopexin-binding protein [Candidatus Anoxychlamydiales bacterium]
MKYIIKLTILCVFVILKAFSVPTNPTIVSGTMITDNISANEINFNVSDKAIINWENFSIDVNEIINFVQPSSQAAVLNRVTSASISEILGNLKANGKLFLINPNGVIIGENAVVDTASFLAATLNISDTDFLSNNLRFVSPGAGSIINYGTIKTKNGDVTIFGKTIENHGDIQVDGSFNVGIGEEIFLQSGGNDNILIKTKTTDATGFTNTKLIEAIKHEIKADGNPYSYAINLDGDMKQPKLEQPELEQEEGRFYLSAVGGKVKISKCIKQDNINIVAHQIETDTTASIESKPQGSIDINSVDRMELNGICKAIGGTITITNDNPQKACFITGEIDVSADVAGLIDINIARLCNGASLKADSINGVGGTIQINSDRIIEVQKALLSATSVNNDGGMIDVFAKDEETVL